MILSIIVLVTPTVFGDTSRVEVTIDDLGWLEGHWAGEFEGTPFEAYYTSTEGEAILSVSKEFIDEDHCFIEFEKFIVKDGQIILTPYPNGKQSVDFVLVDYNPESKSARFENLDHDFPTDITYRSITNDSLLIQVAGPGKDGRQVLEINLKRRK